jgi:hypothetical protein
MCGALMVENLVKNKRMWVSYLGAVVVTAVLFAAGILLTTAALTGILFS